MFPTSTIALRSGTSTVKVPVQKLEEVNERALRFVVNEKQTHYQELQAILTSF